MSAEVLQRFFIYISENFLDVLSILITGDVFFHFKKKIKLSIGPKLKTLVPKYKYLNRTSADKDISRFQDTC